MIVRVASLEPCAMDTSLCKNQGQCRDEPTESKGFQCICPMQYHGEFCEQRTTTARYMRLFGKTRLPLNDLEIQVTSTRSRLTTLDRLA